MGSEELDELVELLSDLRAGSPDTRNTSIRLPGRLHRALALSVEMGMDESMTKAMTEALTNRVEHFARRAVRVQRHQESPETTPSLAEVARMRATFIDDPAGAYPEIIEDVARWWEERNGPWALSRDEYDPANQVLDAVQVLATYPGRTGKAS